MKTLCQVLIIVRLCFYLADLIRKDLVGQKAQEPVGPSGILVSIIAVGLTAAVLYGAGAFGGR